MVKFLLLMVFVEHRIFSSSLVQSLFPLCTLDCVLETIYFSQTILQHLNSFPLCGHPFCWSWCVLHSLGCASGLSGISENWCLHPCVSLLPIGYVSPCCHCTSTCSFSHHSLEVSLSTAMLTSYFLLSYSWHLEFSLKCLKLVVAIHTCPGFTWYLDWLCIQLVRCDILQHWLFLALRYSFGLCNFS